MLYVDGIPWSSEAITSDGVATVGALAYFSDIMGSNIRSSTIIVTSDNQLSGINALSATTANITTLNLGTPLDINDLGDTFETVSKNIKAFPYTLSYSGGRLSSITYTVGMDTIVKTFNYTGSRLTSIVLSGDTPGGIDLTKTLSYTGSLLTSISYS